MPYHGHARPLTAFCEEKYLLVSHEERGEITLRMYDVTGNEGVVLWQFKLPTKDNDAVNEYIQQLI